MEADEMYLRSEISKAIKLNKTKFIRELPLSAISAASDEGVRFWNQGCCRGVDALKHAIAYARSVYKKKAR